MSRGRGVAGGLCVALVALMAAGAAAGAVRIKQIDLAKKQGLAWLQENYAIRGAPPAAGFWSLFYFYYLYSLERVGVLYGIRKLGGHDWYLEGARVLLNAQKPDGSWDASHFKHPTWDTCFAILFLKRATKRLVVTGK